MAATAQGPAMTTAEVRAWKAFCGSLGHPVLDPDGHCDCGQTIIDELRRVG